MALALLAALTALPLLAIDNVTSATAGGVDRAVPVTTVPRADELAARAQQWVDVRERLRLRDLETAEAQAPATTTVPPTTAAAPPASALVAKAPATTARPVTTTARPTTTTARPTTTTARPATPAPKPAPTTKKPAPATPANVPPAPGDPSPEQWAALRNCESGGNYRAIGGGGIFRGAYQFLQSTWDRVAQLVAPQLVGVDPVDASPADQDALALALYRQGGAGQWPRCGVYLH